MHRRWLNPALLLRLNPPLLLRLAPSIGLLLTTQGVALLLRPSPANRRLRLHGPRLRHGRRLRRLHRVGLLTSGCTHRCRAYRTREAEATSAAWLPTNSSIVTCPSPSTSAAAWRRAASSKSVPVASANSSMDRPQTRPHRPQGSALRPSPVRTRSCTGSGAGSGAIIETKAPAKASAAASFFRRSSRSAITGSGTGAASLGALEGEPPEDLLEEEQVFRGR